MVKSSQARDDVGHTEFSPNTRSDDEHCGALGLDIDAMQSSYFVSRQRVVPSAGPGGMALWRERIFAAMARNAGNVTDYFNIPTNRVVELGTRVLI